MAWILRTRARQCDPALRNAAPHLKVFMTTCQKCLAQRRSFLSKAVGLLGAAYSVVGLTPPAFAQVLSVPETTPLDAATAARFYADATQDSVAFALIGKVGEPVRLDPPVEASEQVWTNGVVSRYAVFPLVSYATGKTRAFMYFGNMTVDGIALPARLSIRDDGVLTAKNGDVTSATDASSRTIIFAKWFPIEFAGTTGAPAGLQAETIRRPVVYDLTVAQAAPPNTQELCDQKYHECLISAAAICIPAVAAAAVCAATIAACAAAAETGGLLAIACLKTYGVCSTALGAALACAAALNICRNRAGDCHEEVRRHHNPYLNPNLRLPVFPTRS